MGESRPPLGFVNVRIRFLDLDVVYHHVQSICLCKKAAVLLLPEWLGVDARLSIALSLLRLFTTWDFVVVREFWLKDFIGQDELS